MVTNRGWWFAAAGFVLSSFAYTALNYDQLPDPMPTHWGIHGQADGFTPLPWGAWMGPLISAVILLVGLVLPALSPRGFSLDSVRDIYARIFCWIMAFLAGIQWLGVQSARSGEPLSLPLLWGGLGMLFLLLGNVMPKIPRNYYVGVRTPWTLSDPEAWNRTHRYAGYAFVAGGALILLEAALSAPPALIIATLLATSLGVVVLSYVVYRSLPPRPV